MEEKEIFLAIISWMISIRYFYVCVHLYIDIFLIYIFIYDAVFLIANVSSASCYKVVLLVFCPSYYHCIFVCSIYCTGLS